MKKVYRESAGAHRSENAGMSGERRRIRNHRKTRFGEARPPWVSRGPKERDRKVYQQVDIPVLEVYSDGGRSRLTKPDDWKCLAKQ